ncbi:MAG: hypothetical protein LBS29_04235 [Endomicrobium sp.]|jgi:hypothetical protein|nr:hypothetical protein [Endomicrobium sp.]
MRGVDNGLDVVILVFVFIFGITMCYNSIQLIKYAVNTEQAEKAAPVAWNEITPVMPMYTGGDVALMLVVQDKFIQKPNILRVQKEDNSLMTDVKFDDAWFAYRTPNINIQWRDYLQHLQSMWLRNYDNFSLKYNSSGDLIWTIALS